MFKLNRYFSFLVFIFLASVVCSQDIAVSFPSGSLTLNGTLSLPTGNGPFPAIVLVHGSGPNDRDQTLVLTGGNAACLFPNLLGDTIRNFKDISEGLNNAGYAVLRYDKRTFSHGNQINQVTISPYDFVDDVHNAVDYLKTRTEVDTHCLSILGHSQGTTFAAMVANQRTDIKSIMCLGTPITRVDTLMAEQFRNLYYICLNDTVTGDNYYNQTVSDFNLIRTGNWNASTPYLGAYRTFWNDWMDIGEDTKNQFNNLSIPFLILQAEDDFNVPNSEYTKLQSVVTNPHAVFYSLPGLNHYYTGSNNPIVDAEAIQALTQFLDDNACNQVGIDQINSLEKLNWYQREDDLIVNCGRDWTEVRLLDMMGRQVQGPIRSLGNSNLVSFSQIAKGAYVIQLLKKKEQYSEVVIIR